MTKRHTIRLDSSKRAPPTELLIFPYGEIDTEKGVFLFDKESAKSCMEDYERHGVDLPFDYEHKQIATDSRAGDGIAAGWFSLAVRDDGLWAVGIKWTARAAREIAEAEWRYTSPAFDVDEETNRITRICNIALTNLPATHRIPALVAASKALDCGAKGKIMEDNKKTDEKLAEDVPEAAPESTPQLTLQDVIKLVLELKAQLDNMRSVEKEEHGEDIAVESDPEGTVKMASETDEEEEPEKLSEGVKALLSDVARVTGAKTLAAQRGVLQALADSHAELKRKALDAKKSELSTLIESSLRDGRLVPAQRKWALSLGVEGLRSYLAAAPRRAAVALAESVPPPVVEPTASRVDSETTIGNPDGAAKSVKIEEGGKTFTVHLSKKQLDQCAEMSNKPESYAHTLVMTRIRPNGR